MSTGSPTTQHKRIWGRSIDNCDGFFAWQVDCWKSSAAWDRLWRGRTACSSLGKLVYLMVSFTLMNEGESLVHTAAQVVHAADGECLSGADCLDSDPKR